MHYAMLHTTYLKRFEIAMRATQGQLEALMASDFETLATGSAWTAARTAAGQCAGLGEEANCDGILQAGEDLNANGVLDSPLPGGRFVIQIKNPDGGVPDAQSTLLTLRVAACWTSEGRQIGEDRNCNGHLDAGEDANGNGWADSPAMVSTRVAKNQ